MTATFRRPGEREAAWCHRYARRGAAVVVTHDTRPLDPDQRLADWRAKHDRLPPELRARHRRFEFRAPHEIHNPDIATEGRA
jgi:hypothetical protein